MTVAITYRNTDISRGIVGKGSNLTGSEVDINFFNLDQALATLQANPPAANNIANITVSGMTMTVVLQDGTEIGPLPLPVLQYRFRGVWAPSTLYAALDSFLVPGLGLYSVNIAHTSASSFNAAAVDGSGNPLYAQVWPGDFGAPYVYDVPTTGATVTAAALDVRLLLDPASALATLTVKLPPSPTDGQVYLISTSKAIAALTASPPGSETVNGGSLALAAGTDAVWLYRAANTTWYRLSAGGGGGGGSSLPVNVQSGSSYTILAGDDGSIIAFDGSSPAVTLPDAGGSFFPAGSFVWLLNVTGNEPVTISTSSSLINESGANLVLGNGDSVLLISDGTNYYAPLSSPAPTVLQATPGNPTGTMNTTGVMMGLGAAVITPSGAGPVQIILSGTIANTTSGDGAQAQLYTGIGTAPANGAGLTGTPRGGLVKFGPTSAANQQAPFSLNAIVSGLTPGTPYWIDVGLAAITGGTASISDLSISAVEL